MNKITKRIFSFVTTAAVVLAGAGVFPVLPVPRLETVASADVALTKAANLLTGQDLIIYNNLVPHITAIAAGTETNTQITLGFDVVKSLLGGTTSWTSADLNDTPIMVEGRISSDAMQAVSDKLTFNMKKIIAALKSDYPFDFYWFDGVTANYTYSPQLGFGATSTVLTLSGDSEIIVSLPVAKDYSKTDETGKYELKASKVTAAQTAKANANTIVSDNENKSTIEKLAAFKDAICGNVTYDSYSANSNNNVPYGDPWQMIYVFDNDDGTNVVCEGYAKAFKYLCDNSGIDCILVTGNMDGGTGAGDHMWNIVRLDNTYSLLVDVTNSDEGSIGEDGELFLAYAPCESGQYTFNIDANNTAIYAYDADTTNLFDNTILTLTPFACRVTSVSVSLGGEIGLNIYVSVPDALVTTETHYSLSGPAGSVYTGLYNVQKENDGTYKFTYRVNATQMDEDITLFLSDTQGILYLFKATGLEQYEDNKCVVSVNDYLKAAQNSTELDDDQKALAGAMYTYGAYAAKYFNNTALPTTGLSALSNVTANDLSIYEIDTSILPYKISNIKTTLVLNDLVYARLYFNCSDDISGHTVLLDGNPVIPEVKGSQFYVEIQNIRPDQFTVSHTITIDQLPLNMSAMTYIYRALKNLSDNEDLMNLMKATYAYSQAALACAG